MEKFHIHQARGEFVWVPKKTLINIYDATGEDQSEENIYLNKTVAAEEALDPAISLEPGVPRSRNIELADVDTQICEPEDDLEYFSKMARCQFCIGHVQCTRPGLVLQTKVRGQPVNHRVCDDHLGQKFIPEGKDAFVAYCFSCVGFTREDLFPNLPKNRECGAHEQGRVPAGSQQGATLEQQFKDSMAAGTAGHVGGQAATGLVPGEPDLAPQNLLQPFEGDPPTRGLHGNQHIPTRFSGHMTQGFGVLNTMDDARRGTFRSVPLRDDATAPQARALLRSMEANSQNRAEMVQPAIGFFQGQHHVDTRPIQSDFQPQAQAFLGSQIPPDDLSRHTVVVAPPNPRGDVPLQEASGGLPNIGFQAGGPAQKRPRGVAAPQGTPVGPHQEDGRKRRPGVHPNQGLLPAYAFQARVPPQERFGMGGPAQNNPQGEAWLDRSSEQHDEESAHKPDVLQEILKRQDANFQKVQKQLSEMEGRLGTRLEGIERRLDMEPAEAQGLAQAGVGRADPMAQQGDLGMSLRAQVRVDAADAGGQQHEGASAQSDGAAPGDSATVEQEQAHPAQEPAASADGGQGMGGDGQHDAMLYMCLVPQGAPMPPELQHKIDEAHAAPFRVPRLDKAEVETLCQVLRRLDTALPGSKGDVLEGVARLSITHPEESSGQQPDAAHASAAGGQAGSSGPAAPDDAWRIGAYRPAVEAEAGSPEPPNLLPIAAASAGSPFPPTSPTIVAAQTPPLIAGAEPAAVAPADSGGGAGNSPMEGGDVASTP